MAMIGSLSIAGGAAPGGRYRHWDSLRLQTPPPGLDHPRWWLAVKLARASSYQNLPLRNGRGEPFRLAMDDVVWRLLQRIDAAAFGDLGRSPQLVERRTREALLFRQSVDEAVASSRIEGAPLTRHDAVDLVRENRPPRSVGECMILSNARAMSHVRAVAHLPLTPAMVLELHDRMTDGALDPPECGRLRRDGERVHVHDQAGGILHTPPPAVELPGRLEALCAFANSDDPDLHPVVRAVLIHFQLAYDHPFTDGNGRVARALFTWSLLNRGYGLGEFLSTSRILEQDPSRYTRAFLYVESDDDDTTYFVLNQLEAMLTAVDDLAEYLDWKPRELRRVGRLIEDAAPHGDGLNHRQLDVVRHALDNPGHIYTFAAHRRTHGVSYQTARTDLLGMAEHGVLERAKRGKMFVFAVPRDLENRLAAARITSD